MNNVRLALPNGMMPQVQQAQHVVTLMPDVQLIMTLASHCTDLPTASDRVNMAMDIFAEAHVRHGELPGKIKARQEATEGAN